MDSFAIAVVIVDPIFEAYSYYWQTKADLLQ